MEKKILLSLCHMGGQEIEFIKDAFEQNWIVPLGPNVDGFENSLRDFLGGDHYVAALSSGTAAIHLGLVLLGVKAGDEVICQSFTFSASANPIAYQGAIPVFVDSESDTWNMDPELLEIAIEDRKKQTGKLPKAIIIVHLYGMPAKMKSIMAIARKYSIPLLEDACEAIGSEYEKQKCGTFGELAALSFNGNKIITTSGGGALVCHSDEDAKLARFFATQARDKAPYYQHSHIGYNYRMSNICAGIGRGQMLVLNEHISRRQMIHSLYMELLAGIEGIEVMDNPSLEYNSNFWLTCILVDSSKTGFDYEELRVELSKKNIETRPLWKPMHLQPVFKDMSFYGNGTSEQLFNTGLCLPSGSMLADEDIIFVVNSIKEFLVEKNASK